MTMPARHSLKFPGLTVVPDSGVLVVASKRHERGDVVHAEDRVVQRPGADLRRPDLQRLLVPRALAIP